MSDYYPENEVVDAEVTQDDTDFAPAGDDANDDSSSSPAPSEHEEHSQEEYVEEAPAQVADGRAAHKPHLRDRLREEKHRLREEQYLHGQTYAEKERLRAEVERLQKVANASTQTALSHYEDAASQRLEMAKERKIRALESGDVQEQTDADVALMKATQEQQNLLNLKAREEVLRQDHYQAAPAARETDRGGNDRLAAQQDYELQRWVSQNQWFHPQSASYNPDMADAVQDFCEQFDHRIAQAGLQSQIGSPNYFNEVNKFVHQNFSQPQQPPKKDLSMRTPNTPVGAVRQMRTGAAPQPTQRSQVKLTPGQQEMARRLNASLGIKEGEYARNVVLDRQKQLAKGATSGR